MRRIRPLALLFWFNLWELFCEGTSMIHRPGKLLSHFWSPQGGPYPLLVLLFLTIFVISPLLSARIVMPIIFQTFFWLIIVAGAFNVSSRTIPSADRPDDSPVVNSLAVAGSVVLGKNNPRSGHIFSLGMLSIFALLMIQSFLVTGRAWEHRIAAVVAVYLLIGSYGRDYTKSWNCWHRELSASRKVSI